MFRTVSDDFSVIFFWEVSGSLIREFSYASRPIIIDARRWDPVTATASASVKTVSNMVDATVGIVRAPIEEYKRSQPNRSNPEPGVELDKSRVTKDNETVVLANNAVKQRGLHIAGAMALASAGSLGKVFVSSSKGILIDIPFAMAEGLHSLPRYYDTTTTDKSINQVTDIQSGFKLAGTSFGYGIYEGVTDVFKYTWKGKQEEGAKGVAKGLSKGLMSFTTKVSGAVVGLVAYPGRGIERSVMNFVKGDVRKEIADMKKKEGDWLLAHRKSNGIVSDSLVAGFNQIF